MFLKQRAAVQSMHPQAKTRKTSRMTHRPAPRAARGGGVMAFAATFTAVTWIGGGVLMHGMIQDLRAEQARLANVAALGAIACPSDRLVAEGPANAPVRLSEVTSLPAETAPRHGRSPLFAQAIED